MLIREFLGRVALCTGELPLAIGQLKANGCDVKLLGNKGFTLSSDISAVKDAAKLDFRNCDLSGACCVEPVLHRKEPNRGTFLARSLCAQARSRLSSGG